MSFEAILDNGEAIQVATNKGWNDVTRWIETLPKGQGFGALHFLGDEGQSDRLDELPDVIAEAMDEKAPSASVRTTLEGLLALVKKNPDANQLIISSGA